MTPISGATGVAALGSIPSLDWGKVTRRQPHTRARPSSRCPFRRARRSVQEGVAMQRPHPRRRPGVERPAGAREDA